MMKNRFWALLCCLTLLAGLFPAAALGAGKEAWWYESSVYTEGTLAEGIEAVKNGRVDGEEVYLQSDITNAAYVLDNITLDIYFEGHTVTAAPNQPAFTVRNGTRVWFLLSGGSIKGGTTCIHMESTAAYADVYGDGTNSGLPGGTLTPAEGHPAILQEGGELVIELRPVLDAEVGVLHQGGSIWLYDTVLGTTIRNESGASLVPSFYEPGYYMTVNGSKVTELEHGKTAALDARFTVEFDVDGGSGTAPAPITGIHPGSTISLPESTFVPDPDCEFRGWVEYWTGTSYQPGESVVVNGNLYLIADHTPAVLIDGVNLPNGKYLDESGNLSDGKPDGGYAFRKDGKLILHDFHGEEIEIDTALEIVLEGENQLKSSDDNLSVSYAEVSVSGSGSLKLESRNDNPIDIDSGGSLHIKGGRLDLFALANSSGSTDDAIDIDGGTMIISGDAVVNITVSECTGSADDGIDLYNGSLLHIRGGKVNIRATDHGIEAVDASVLIDGGELTINAGDNAIDADEGIVINGGKLDLTAEDSGIDTENGSVIINGGDITINARNRYGISVAHEDDESHSIVINGGRLNVKAGVHALVSAGDIQMNGGTGTVMVTSADGLAIAAEKGITTTLGLAVIRINAKDADGDERTYFTFGEAGKALTAFGYELTGSGSAPVSQDPVPQTGDRMPLALLAVLMTVSVFAMALMIQKRRA